MISMTTVRPLDPAGPDALAIAALAASDAAEGLNDFEYEQPEPLRAFAAALAAAGAPLRGWLAEDDGRPCGYGLLLPIVWQPEPGCYWLIVRVRADSRRRGIGRQLYARLRSALPAGAVATRAMVRETLPDLVALAEREGFREVLRSRPYDLDLALPIPPSFEQSRARFAAGGLTIRSLTELQAIGADWLPPLFALHAALTADIPIATNPLPTPGWFTETAGRLPEAFFVALDGERYIGESYLHPADEAGLINQQITGVLPAYRGRGVATALKLATIEYARAAGYRSIRTWVETNNASMLAINAALGFVEGRGCILFERRPAV